MTARTHRVTVLGDSRVFDTYYATAIYRDTAYGYHKTFPHLLQRALAKNEGADIDCVHIPDHFRGRTLPNNILRLALTDPSAVVLCDGIWESLVSKKHFIEHVERTLADTATADRGVSIEYSERAIVSLFEAGKLALSPTAYAERVATIASWFVRRRRKALWLTTPIPPKEHLGGLHYAGNYRPFPGWHDCLAILNRETTKAATAAGADILDLQALVEEHGGAGKCLIDQWHFSAHFHDAIAGRLAAWAGAELPALSPVRFEVSSRVMVQGPAAGLKAHLIGPDAAAGDFRHAHPDLTVVGTSALPPRTASDVTADAWIVVTPGKEERERLAAQLLRQIPERAVVLFPEDLAPLDNPAVADRSTFGQFK